MTLCLLAPGRVVTTQEQSAGARVSERELQAVVDTLRGRLQIAQRVVVEIVPYDSRLVSVTAPADDAGVYRLSIERGFLRSLSDEELAAAVAHELGHVWVFVHQPYRQTEHLANQIALRVVGRESLERVYEKAWQRGGTREDLAVFLGPTGQTETAGLAGSSPSK